jgi:hypothetical protein
MAYKLLSKMRDIISKEYKEGRIPGMVNIYGGNKIPDI